MHPTPCQRALRTFTQVAALATLLTTPTFALDHGHDHAATAKPTAEAPTAMTAMRADLVGNVSYASGQLMTLAKAVPADKYAWRPAAGVRSYAEVLLHVAGANYLLPQMLGMELPKDAPDLAKIETTATDKDSVLVILEKSIAFAKTTFETFPAEKLDNQVDFFGNKMSSRAVLLILQGHIHEHLGQSIAYARMNGIAPPWSQ
jgi:uncharacterized damage-inducible protein DinB